MTDCANCGSIGAKLIMLVEPKPGVGDTTFDENSERYEILAEGVGIRDVLVGAQGLTGELGMNAAHLREGPSYVQGTFLMNVSAADLDNWLPRILGGSETADVHSAGDSFPKFDIMLKRDEVVYRYSDCVVAAVMFRGDHDANKQEPQLIEMAVSIVGSTETKGTMPGTVPGLPTDGPLYWLFADSTLTLDGTDYVYSAFSLLIDNQIQVLHRNSLSPVCFRTMGRKVLFRPRLPLCGAAADDLYFSRLDGAAKLAFAADKYIDGASTMVTEFDMPRVVNTKRSPRTRGRSEIPLELDLTAYLSGSDQEISVTNVLGA